eukprot:g75076.t1
MSVRQECTELTAGHSSHTFYGGRSETFAQVKGEDSEESLKTMSLLQAKSKSRRTGLRVQRERSLSWKLSVSLRFLCSVSRVIG